MNNFTGPANRNEVTIKQCLWCGKDLPAGSTSNYCCVTHKFEHKDNIRAWEDWQEIQDSYEYYR